MNTKLFNPIIYYFLIIYFLAMIVTRNETATTSIIIALWYSVPMSLLYSFELFLFDKSKDGVSLKVILISALLNTILGTILLSVAGIYLLAFLVEYMGN